MPDHAAHKAALILAAANLIGAITDAHTALDAGQFAMAAHYAADANYWDGQIQALRKVGPGEGE